MKCTHLPKELNRYSSEYTMVVLPHPCGALMPICPRHTPQSSTPQKHHKCVSGSGTIFPYILVFPEGAGTAYKGHEKAHQAICWEINAQVEQTLGFGHPVMVFCHIPPEVELNLLLPHTLKYGVPIPVCTTGKLAHNSDTHALFRTLKVQTH
jgi:hypothetical protein